MKRLRSLLFLLVIAALPLIGTPSPAAGVDYILCSCKLCKESPDTICQISPKGYSILCSDWYRIHC